MSYEIIELIEDGYIVIMIKNQWVHDGMVPFKEENSLIGKEQFS